MTDNLKYADGFLYGESGGQLEYVSQRIEWKYRNAQEGTVPYIIIKFTDHDVYPDGKFYEISFEIHCP